MRMKRICLSLWTVSLLLSGCAGGPDRASAVEPNHLSALEQEQGWTLLFDGETTAGWRNYMAEGVSAGWSVVDGALTMTGRGGDLITEDRFGSFELRLQWRISEGGNSGIMYHVVEGPPAPYMSGPEMQVLDNSGHTNGVDVLTSAGACYGLYAPSVDATRPVGEWNEVRLVVDRGHVEHWLNGVLLCEYQIGSDEWRKLVEESKFGDWPTFGVAREGHICLQDHGDVVSYRDIKLREL